jgi:hypothetical protein
MDPIESGGMREFQKDSGGGAWSLSTFETVFVVL